MSSVEAYVHRTRSGAFYSVLVLLCVFPVMGVGSLLRDSLGTLPTTVGVLLVVALAAAFYAFFVTEVRLVIDGGHVRLTEQDVAFGSRRETKLLWELPLAELTAVQEITTRTPSERGGWIHSSVLHFPGDRKLTEHALGTRAVPSSEYNRLVQSLRARLGDRFTAEERA